MAEKGNNSIWAEYKSSLQGQNVDLIEEVRGVAYLTGKTRSLALMGLLGVGVGLVTDRFLGSQELVGLASKGITGVGTVLLGVSVVGEVIAHKFMGVIREEQLRRRLR